MPKLSKAEKAELKAERARIIADKKAKAKARNDKVRSVMKKYGPTVLGLRIPGFFRIHIRYAKRSFTTWFVLFIAPFVVSIMVSRQLATKVFGLNPSDLQLYILAFLLIALAFFFAERHRGFRRIYVRAIPALVIVYGLIGIATDPGQFPGTLFKFGIITLLPAWWLWKHAADQGYKTLSDGADPDYRPGRDLYMEGDYEKAFAHLEPAAKRGHMKSLYLLGHAHEHGNARKRDRVRAARFYTRASRRGYRKATRAFDTLFETFNTEEIERFETELGATGLHELF